jgi:hypothetical protein
MYCKYEELIAVAFRNFYTEVTKKKEVSWVMGLT